MIKTATPILISLFFLAVWGLNAQQLPQYSMYMLNPYAWNPAAAGAENSLVLTGVYRQQWADLPGAPVGQQVNGHLPLEFISSGVGVKLDNDMIGAHRTTQALLTYAYHLEFGRNARLSAGFSGGYLQYSLDGSKLRAPQGTYVEPSGVFTHNDVSLPEEIITAGTVVGEAGVQLNVQNLTLGAAVQPVFAPVLKAGQNGTFQLQPVRQYLFSGSYNIVLGQDFEVKPGFFAKTDFFLTQIEVSANFQWRQNIFAGISYRGVSAKAKDAMVWMAGWRLNEKTMAAYAFDLPLSPLKSVNRGSHELLLRYNLNKPIGRGTLPPVIYNPRFW